MNFCEAGFDIATEYCSCYASYIIIRCYTLRYQRCWSAVIRGCFVWDASKN